MRFFGRTTLALSLACAVLVPAQFAAAESPSEPGGQRLLAKQNHGRAAIKALGENVDEAAKVNGISASEFKRKLGADKSLWVGRDGRMFYVDAAHPAEEAAAEQATEVQAASAALEDTFLLHSLPDSNHTIYLDFGSVTVNTSSWWYQNGGMSAQTFTGYSQDGDPAFNDTEKTFVQQVWSIVAEKYAAFDVDVTTENPGSNGYNRTSGGDPTWGTRVAVTSDDAALAQACGGCAGVALIDVFDTVDSGQYEPAWVFTDMLGTATLTANAAAHEIGHTFGLYHDDTASTSYYSGHNHWVPIMGITNSKAVAQFSKGEYSGANQTQDDLAIIAGNGAPLRSDDAGNTTGTATALPSAASYEVNGIITSATDKDVYAVSRDCVNDLTATATGIGTGQTLDLKVSVYDTALALVGADDVASSNVGAVATGMNAEYTAVSAAASTYYVEVDGVGSGGLGNVPNPSTGYTDYASIGQYTLAITGCPVSTDPPTAPQSITASPTLRSTDGSVSWSAPASNGGGPITGYTVTGMPGAPSVDLPAGTTSIATTTLVPGTTYAVSVIAKNAYGDSPAADVNLKVPTWVPSAAPTVSPTVSGKDASATWTSIANPGLATITGWDTVLKKGLTTVASSTVLVADPRSISYEDLEPGAYTLSVTVAATAEDGTGATAGTANFTINGDKPSAPQSLTANHTAKTTTGTVSWTAPASEGDAPVTGYTVGGLPGPDVTTTSTNIVATGLNPGATYNVSVVANNTYGSSTAAATTLDVDTWVPTAPPGVNVSVGATTGNVTWTAPANPGGATITGWTVVLTRPSGTPITRNLSAATLATSFTGLTPGAHSVAVTVVATADDTVGETPGTKAFTVPSKPSAPQIGTPSFGTKGGAITAIARWAAPTSTGGSPITSYKVIAYKLTAAGSVVKAYYSQVLSASARSYKWTTLPAGKYKFRVVAYNVAGTSPYSAYSTKVLAQ